MVLEMCGGEAWSPEGLCAAVACGGGSLEGGIALLPSCCSTDTDPPAAAALDPSLHRTSRAKFSSIRRSIHDSLV